jgi:hypothetical protein
MSRTPYSPFVLKETAPLPWNAGRVLGGGVVAWLSGGSSIPSEFVGIECRAKPDRGSTRVAEWRSARRFLTRTVRIGAAS